MPTPAVTLRLRRFRRRFGITAPRVVVRGHFPWQWFAIPVILLLLLLGAVGWLVVQRSSEGELGRELAELRQQTVQQREELESLRATAGTGKNTLNIERAAQRKLMQQIQGLEQENSVLKEDVLLFERLSSVAGEAAAVRVENFRIARDAGSRYRYRLLLIFQPTRRIPDFCGRLQFVVNFLLQGKVQKIVLPASQEAAGEYSFELKHFLRREGVFELPPGAQLRHVEARVLQGATVKAKQLAQI